MSKRLTTAEIARRLDRLQRDVAFIVRSLKQEPSRAIADASNQVAVSADAVARMLKIRRGKVYELHERGELVGFRMDGSRLRFLVSDVRDYAERQRTHALQGK